MILDSFGRSPHSSAVRHFFKFFFYKINKPPFSLVSLLHRKLSRKSFSLKKTLEAIEDINIRWLFVRAEKVEHKSAAHPARWTLGSIWRRSDTRSVSVMNLNLSVWDSLEQMCKYVWRRTCLRDLLTWTFSYIIIFIMLRVNCSKHILKDKLFFFKSVTKAVLWRETFAVVETLQTLDGRPSSLFSPMQHFLFCLVRLRILAGRTCMRQRTL